MNQRFVMLIGNPGDGFVVVGPFDNHNEAFQYLEVERAKEDCWIVELHAPASDEEEQS